MRVKASNRDGGFFVTDEAEGLSGRAGLGLLSSVAAHDNRTAQGITDRPHGWMASTALRLSYAPLLIPARGPCREGAPRFDHRGTAILTTSSISQLRSGSPRVADCSH